MCAGDDQRRTGASGTVPVLADGGRRSREPRHDRLVLLTLTTTHRPATDLGYLLVKHPDRVHRFELPYGTASVLFPVATEECATAALLLEINPQRLDQGRGNRGGAQDRGGSQQLGRYVNDRPYAASSLLPAALNRVFRT